MNESKWAVPAQNKLVRDPITLKPLGETGKLIPWIGPEGRYWRRRLSDGSIIIYDEEPKVITNNKKKVVEEIADDKF